MPQEERRKHSRVNSINLVSYTCMDENKEPVTQGMGRTLNVNEEGIQLETHAPIDQRHILSLSIGVKDDLLDIQGKAVYCIKGEDGMFRSGIQLMEMDESSLRVLRDYIAGFKGH
ncbi:MAG: PilZ domain-containing protein [Thermodesulfobacteriota bacterium]|nr:PilZ domain-containing protein [Thermodesulfobacteriota bacterium]